MTIDFLGFALGVLASLIAAILYVSIDDKVKSLWRLLLREEAKDPFSGRWVASFDFNSEGTRKSYNEVIQIRRKWGRYEGRIVPDERNYAALKRYHQNRPLRFVGDQVSGNILSGTWFHPIEKSHVHGTFQLIHEPDGSEMGGFWLGYINRTRNIEYGSWKFSRFDESA